MSWRKRWSKRKARSWTKCLEPKRPQRSRSSMPRSGSMASGCRSARGLWGAKPPKRTRSRLSASCSRWMSSRVICRTARQCSRPISGSCTRGWRARLSATVPIGISRRLWADIRRWVTSLTILIFDKDWLSAFSQGNFIGLVVSAQLYV